MENSPVTVTGGQTICFSTHSNSRWLNFGALKDHISSRVNFVEAENYNFEKSRSYLSAGFLTSLCLILGIISHVKFEVATYSAMKMMNDLHFVITSSEDKLYIDDIDLTMLHLTLEAADILAVLISCVLIWMSSKLKSPIREYAFLPWLGLTLRGLLLREGPTAIALAFVFAVVEENIRPVFCAAYTLLLLIQIRLWLDIGRLVLSRWSRYNLEQIRDSAKKNEKKTEMEPASAWNNETDLSLSNIQSVEVNSHIY